MEDREKTTTVTLSREDTAKQLGISVVTLDRAVAGRKIGCYRLGKRVLFGQKHLDEFLEANEQKPKRRVVKSSLLMEVKS